MPLNNPSIESTVVETSYTLQSNTSTNIPGTAISLAPNTRDVLLVVSPIGTPTVLNIHIEIWDAFNQVWIAGAVENVVETNPLKTLLSVLSNPTERYYCLYRHKPGFSQLRARVSGRLNGSVTVTAIKRDRVL